MSTDKDYNNYAWHSYLAEKRVSSVIQLKSNAKQQIVCRHPALKNKGLICDQTINVTGTQTVKKYLAQLRHISYRDTKTGRHYMFLTNNFKLVMKTVADIYKARWQVKMFFKRIKQNLKIKSFVGTSKNTVISRIWIMLCIYLLLAFLKFQSKLQKSTQQAGRLLQLNLFKKRSLMALLIGNPSCNQQPDINKMILL